jgi:hypothetical protein
MARLWPLAFFAQRLLARVSLALYFGGFTYYASVVVPDLHDSLGGMETGVISRRVVISLYAIGGVAFGLGWLGFAIDREQRIGWIGKTRFGLLALNTLIWIVLMLMHRSLGAQIDSSGEMKAFRSFHELYLTVWTGQWLGILGLLGLDSMRSKSSPNSD